MNENTALYRAIEQAVILPCAGEMESIADVECDFSETYKKKVNRLIKDRSRPYYPLIKTTLRKTIFIIAAVLMMSTITVAAVPQLREWFVGLFVSQNENNADVHAVQGAIPADDMNDEFIYYEPTFIPKGFVEESRIKDIAHLGIDYRFKNKIIFYSQSPLTATHNIDTENRKTEYVTVSGCEAFLSYDDNSSIIMMCSLSMSVSANSVIDYVEPGIELMYLYTDNVSTSVYRSGSNIAYKCDAKGKSTATKISIYLYLQEYSNGAWSNVDVVTKAVNGRSAYVSDTYSSAVSGRKYRTEAHVYVYSGSKYEYLEVNSGTLIF